MNHEPNPSKLITRIDYTIASIKDEAEHMPEELQLLADEAIAKLSEFTSTIRINTLEIELQKIDEKSKTLKEKLKSLREGH
jgi:hypothetical protein